MTDPPRAGRGALGGVYDRHLLPHLVDCVCGSRTVEYQRRLVVPQAAGRVLEIGFGSGLNLPHYDRARVEAVWALEPSAPMRALAAGRIVASGLEVRLLDAPAEELPLPDASVDSVVVTFSLCTIPDPLAALRQARRVLRPGGALLFCEHGAAPDEAVRRWQRRLDGIWSRLSGGCHLDRDVGAMIAATGFEPESLHTAYLTGTPRVAGFNTWGCARPASVRGSGLGHHHSDHHSGHHSGHQVGGHDAGHGSAAPQTAEAARDPEGAISDETRCHPSP